MARNGRNPVFFIIAIVSLIAFMYSAPGHAATIDAAGASHLKTVFSDMIKKQSTAIGNSGTKLVVDGEVMVEPSGGYYAVTLPHLSTVAADNSRLEIGMIAINVIPDETPEQWKMSLALPTPLVWRDGAGAEKVSITIGKQNFAGIWSEKLNYFVKLKAEYRDVKVNTPDKSFLGAASTVTFVTDQSAETNGTNTGAFTVTGLVGALSNGTAVSIGKLESTSLITSYSPGAFKAYQDKIGSLNVGNAAAMTPEDKLKLYDAFSEMLGTMFDDMSVKLAAENIVVTHPGAAPAESGKVTLGHAGFDLGFKGFRKEKVSLQFAHHYDGLAVVPPPPGFTAAIPDRFNLAISVDNLPFKTLVDLGRKNFVPDPASPSPAGSPLALLASLPQVLQEAGAAVALQDFSFGNSVYGQQSTGTLHVDTQAVKSFVGKGRSEITGLENLSASMAAQMSDPNSPADIKAGLQKVAGVVTMLQMFGQQGTNAQGQPMRSYDFELNQQGQMLLNGADINTLFGGAPPAAGAQGAAPAPVEP